MNSKLVKQVVFVFSAIMMLSVVPAQAEPYLELIGPDSVQLGHTAAYTVTTVGGTDSSYTWWGSYSSNDSATISQEGVLTTMNAGVFGLQVIGNDTGASASLHIEVVPNEYGGVAIAGPDEVAVGGKITLTATTGGVSSYWYSWIPENCSSEPWFGLINMTVGADENAVEIEGLQAGWVEIMAMDPAGLRATKRVDIVNKVDKPQVRISAGLGEYFTLVVMLTIEGKSIPADAILYIAVKYDGVIHYLPTLSTTATPFRANPTETYYEKVYSVPILNIPLKTYTFYAAIMDSQFQFVSNLAEASIKAGTETGN